jgi:hypothetical protein
MILCLGDGHDPANLFKACCGRMPMITMARQDFIKCCMRPHAIDYGIPLGMTCMTRGTSTGV